MEDKIVDKVKEEDSACCAPTPSVCGPSASCCGSQELNQISSSNKLNEKIVSPIRNPDKLNVDIYVPLDACVCEWDKFMNRIFLELTPYMKNIDFETKNLNSEEARKFNITSKCVLIEGQKKYTSSLTLRKELPKLLKAKGLN